MTGRIDVIDHLSAMATEEPWLFQVDFDWRSIPEDDEESLTDMFCNVGYLGRRALPNALINSLGEAITVELKRREKKTPELVEPVALSVPTDASNQELVNAVRVLLRVAELPMRKTVGVLVDKYLAACVEMMGCRLTTADQLRSMGINE